MYLFVHLSSTFYESNHTQNENKKGEGKKQGNPAYQLEGRGPNDLYF